MQQRLNELQLHLNRDIRPRDLPRVVRVINDALKSEKLCHPVTVKRPGGAVKHRGSHRGEVEPRPEFLQVLDIAAEPLEVPEPGVTERIRLRRDPVCVAGSDGVPVLIGKFQKSRPRRVQIPDNPHDLIADHRALERGMHVLRRAPGVDERHLDPGLLDEKGFVAHIHLRARIPGGVPHRDHPLLRFAPGSDRLPVEKPRRGIRHKGGFIDFGEPIKLVPRGCPAPGLQIRFLSGFAD